MAKTLSTKARRLPPWPVAVAIALLALVALTGGGARADIVSLVVLRPLSVLIAGWAVVGLTSADRAAFRDWLVLAVCVIALLVIHLVPLPPTLWHALPGRELIVAIDDVTGHPDAWRPLSMAPEMTRNALWSLAAPLGALCLAMRADRDGRRLLLAAIVLTGFVSGIIGVIQYASGPDSPLYLYRISNFGQAVGLFANRNHAGVFLACQFPLLVAYVLCGDERKRRARMVGAVAMGAALVPMILTTGSRAGLITGVMGLIGAALIVRPHLGQILPSRTKAKSQRWLVGGLAIAFLAFCAIFIGLNQGNSIDRLLGGGDSQAELRWPIWRATLTAVGQVFPWGSGFGGFPYVFQVFEPDAMLGPTYVNHAHNDFLEIVLDAGIPGIILLAAALWFIARDAWRVWRARHVGARVIAGRAAAVALLQLVVASAADYPLRTPLLAVVGALLVVLLRRGAMAAREFSADSPSAPRNP